MGPETCVPSQHMQTPVLPSVCAGHQRGTPSPHGHTPIHGSSAGFHVSMPVPAAQVQQAATAG